MKSIRGTHAAMFVCIALAASGCHQLSSQSLVVPAKAVGRDVAQGESGTYFGDAFSEVQKALAALPASTQRDMSLGD